MQAELMFPAGCYFYTFFKEDDIVSTAKKLPSGSWHVRVFSHTEEIMQPDAGSERHDHGIPCSTCCVWANLSPDKVSHRFSSIFKRAGLPHFRFHDLRHYSASIQHAIGIPDAYIMQRGGWASDNVLKTVYRHALQGESEKQTAKITKHFEKLYDTKYDTNRKSS